ncbi:hypothetical protein BS78_08G009800 [Paspalum vaginatum]|nr:hypothetical protein BS78_08G009800 [Paspalum vaginatum]
MWAVVFPLKSTGQRSSTICFRFDKSGLEANEDSIYSTGKLAQVEAPPLVEGIISSETYVSLEEKDSTILKSGGAEDILSRYNLDEEEENYVQDDGLVELCDPYQRVSKKETIKNGMKWMSEECFLAFTKYADKTEDINYKFGELLYQCLSVEACDKILHHYNFTIEATHVSSGVSTSDLYFAEVKQLSGVKSYFCCLLEENDKGHCYGCKSQGMSDLKHPSTSCYEEGAVDICWPFIDDTDSDNDDEDDSEDYSDCGGVGCD